jgi:opacity protein-like surface antigen
MKKFLLFMTLAFGLMSFSYQSDVESIVNAFKSADAGQIGSHFDDYVDIKLLDKDEVKNIGRTQATITLKAFFAENGVKGFEKASEREIGNTMYLAGKLLTNGKGNNITIMLKVKDGKRQIITIRIS